MDSWEVEQQWNFTRWAIHNYCWLTLNGKTFWPEGLGQLLTCSCKQLTRTFGPKRVLPLSINQQLCTAHVKVCNQHLYNCIQYMHHYSITLSGMWHGWHEIVSSSLLWLPCTQCHHPSFITTDSVTCHCMTSSLWLTCIIFIILHNLTLYCRNGLQSLRSRVTLHPNHQLQNLYGLGCFSGSKVSLSTGSYEDCVHSTDRCIARECQMGHLTVHTGIQYRVVLYRLFMRDPILCTHISFSL